MGCGASKTRTDEDVLHLFVAKARNGGTSVDLINDVPNEKRADLVKGYGIREQADLDIILKNWSKLPDVGAEQLRAQKGVSKYCKIGLPQNDPADRQKERQEEIAERQKEYQFEWPTHKGHNLPPYVKQLPRAEQVGTDHAIGMFATHTQTKASLNFNKVIDMISNLFVTEDPFKDWADLYRTSEVPEIAINNRWKTDIEFAQQKFNGINPTLVRRLKPDMPILQKIPVTEEILKGVIPAHTSLKQLNDEGRLYVCDYEELDGLPSDPDRYLCAPIALFFIDDDKKIKPAAIQLFQKPCPTNPIFTPNPEHTDPGAWLVAKTHCQVADAIMHEVTSHYLATHAYIETIYISMMRHLSVMHPLSELIRPHFWYTMAIQDSARKDLIGGPDGQCALPRLMACGYDGMAALLSKTWENWRFTRYNLPKRLEVRGMHDPAIIPNIYYRDDGVPMYRAIERFVTDCVKDFYPKDTSLSQDTELQSWANEMATVLKLKDLPLDGNNRFVNQQQVVDFVTGVIFAATAGHSMVNNGQWDYFGFIPNCPGTFRFPPPTDAKQKITDKEIAKALPNDTDTKDQIAVVKTLSTKPKIRIGEYQSSFMAGRPTIHPFIKQFQTDLDNLSKSIEARNAKLKEAKEIPYPYLDPKNTSQSCNV